MFSLWVSQNTSFQTKWSWDIGAKCVSAVSSTEKENLPFRQQKKKICAILSTERKVIYCFTNTHDPHQINFEGMQIEVPRNWINHTSAFVDDVLFFVPLKVIYSKIGTKMGAKMMWSVRDCGVVTPRPRCGQSETEVWSVRDRGVVSLRPKCGQSETEVWSVRDQGVVSPRLRRGQSEVEARRGQSETEVWSIWDSCVVSPRLRCGQSETQVWSIWDLGGQNISDSKKFVQCNVI